MDIYKPSKDFNFNLFSLENPQPVQGGSYFTRVVNNNDKPLFIQLPKCTTKQGVVKTNRGLYCDLMYTKNQCDEFIEWVLALEKYLQDKINDKKDLWFTTEITSDDIESMTTPIYRLYKSGKILLIRTTVDVDKSTNEGKCMVYSEDEIKLSVDNITNTVNIIPLIKIEGIKFTSKSFDIEIKLVQSMVLNKEPEIMQTCMIKREDKNNTQDKLLDSSDGDKTKTLHKDMVTNPHYELEQSNITEINSKKITQEQNNEAQSIEASENKEQMNEEEITEAPDIKEPSSEEQFVNETIKEKEEKNILDYENNDDLEKSPIDLEEITINPDGEDSISIKNPKEIYEEIYRVARIKAKKMRAASIEAFLEAKKIKSQYVLDDIEDSDSEDYTDDEVNDF
tara:strand:+ start:1040 stop:2224 length:1185 start_codon:yes stop_codon:yes gene_type:complete